MLNFLEFIQTHRRGELLHEADTALTELITAIKETGGNGALVIKLPFKVNKAGQLECDPVVEALAELDSDGGMSLDEVEVASVIATLAVMATRQMGLHPTWIIAMVAEGLLDADNPVPDVAEVQIRGVVS